MEQPRWFADAIRGAVHLPFVELVRIIVPDREPGSNVPSNGSPARSFARIARSALYHLYVRLDRWYFPPEQNPHRTSDLRRLLEIGYSADEPSRNGLVASAVDQRDVLSVIPDDVDLIMSRGIDVSTFDVPATATYGLWYFDGELCDASPLQPGFAGVYNECASSYIALVSRMSDNRMRVMESHTRTDPLSVSRTAESVYRKAELLLKTALASLHASRSQNPTRDPRPSSHFRTPGAYGIDPEYKGRIKRPGNGQMLGMMARLSRRRLRTALRELTTTEEWCIGFSFQGSKSDPVDVGFADLEILTGPQDRYWADPHPICVEDRYYVFFEEFMLESGKGHISVLELRPDGTHSEPVRVLERPHHLSYPFIFKHESEIYMAPETGESGGIDLFRASRFPHDWELAACMLEGCTAVDPTVARIDERWWLFTSLGDGHPRRAPTDELHLFHAPHPEGPWKPHPLNPVKSDVRSARPAGRLISTSGKLYRPAQDCALFYGHSIAINRVDVISLHDYRETVVSRILPDWAPRLQGTHTLNTAGELTVIDGFRRAPRSWLTRGGSD